MVDIFPLQMLFGSGVKWEFFQVKFTYRFHSLFSLLSSVDAAHSGASQRTDRWPAFSLSFGLFDTAERNEPDLTEERQLLD